MPMLYSLGQHEALLSVQDSLLPDEKLFAYLDDLYVVCPERVVPIFKLFACALEEHARIQVHLGKIQVWNRGVMSLLGAMHSRQPLNWWTHTPESGVDMNRGSGCWASRLVTPTL